MISFSFLQENTDGSTSVFLFIFLITVVQFELFHITAANIWWKEIRVTSLILIPLNEIQRIEFVSVQCNVSVTPAALWTLQNDLTKNFWFSFKYVEIGQK